MQDLEKRVEELEAFKRGFWERQVNKKSRYAYETYVKARCDRLVKANKETAKLAATSKAVGEKALAVALIGLMFGFASSIFGLLTLCSPRTPR